jgi:hypothetical protein
MMHAIFGGFGIGLESVQLTVSIKKKNSLVFCVHNNLIDNEKENSCKRSKARL